MMIIIKPTLLHNEQSISWGQRGVEQERGAKVVCGHRAINIAPNQRHDDDDDNFVMMAMIMLMN